MWDEEEKRCCGTCCYHMKHVGDDRHKDDWWCSCEESGAYGDFTNFSDACSEYEERDD